MSNITLHGYFRSSAAHRVRIALNLKDLAYEQKFYHLRRGEQRSAEYLALNPQGLVPTLEHDGVRITQSLAILEYLEELFPEPALLPPDSAGRARVRALADICAVDTHPLNNLRVLKYLEDDLGLDEPVRLRWCQHWLQSCFGPLESRLATEPDSRKFCHGDTPSFADICLVPQVLSAKRFGFDLAPFPHAVRHYEACCSLLPFQQAMPDRQPDHE